jgi:alpha/beta superfamily hydrolase
VSVPSKVRAFRFAGPAGALEAIWKDPESPARGSAVVAHAHPLHGGTMHFKVVYRIAKALSRAGYGVLRFNFRGVGASQGNYGGGIGEREDVRAALDQAQRLGGAPLLAAGFSFGSVMALSVGAADARVAALVGAGVPIDRWRFEDVGRVMKPALLVSGSRDSFGDPAELERLARERFADGRVVVVEGADHFFTGCLGDVESAVYDFASAPAAVAAP